MIRKFINMFAALAVTASTAAIAYGQDPIITKKEVITHPDGSYTVIEYPVGREVTVTLLPGSMIAGAKGTARVIRSSDGTKIFFNMSGLPSTHTQFYAYALDPNGTPSFLGPITVTNGVGTGEFTTSLNQFMLVLSPTEGVTAFTPETIYFHSEVPTGFAVVPRKSGLPTAAVAGVTRFNYNVPLLGVNTFRDSGREFPIRFSGELRKLEGKIHINREKGSTKVKLRFEEMKKIPAGKRFALWTYSPTGEYSKLGQIVSSGRKDSATMQAYTSLTDFGLLLTVEEADVNFPSSQIYTVIGSNVVTTPTVLATTPAGTVVARTPTRATTVVTTPGAFNYNVPLLGVNTFVDSGKEFHIRFPEPYGDLEGTVHINRENGTTKVKLHFDDLEDVPAGKQFALWIHGPDGKYTKLGQAVSTGRKEEATIQSYTSLTNFGVLITIEDAEVSVPTSRIYTVVKL